MESAASSVPAVESPVSRVRQVLAALALVPIAIFVIWVERNCSLPWIGAEARFPWVVVDLPVAGLAVWNLTLLALAFVLPQRFLRGTGPRLAAGAAASLVSIPLWQGTGVVVWSLLPPGFSAGILTALIAFFAFAGILAWGVHAAREGRPRAFETAACLALVATPLLTLDRVIVLAASVLWLFIRR